MVKGVNKRVIEVNNTGNKFFEKIVFYVTPEYGDLSAEQLYNAAEFLSLNLGYYTGFGKPLLRKSRIKRRKRLILAISLSVIVLVGLILKIIL